MKLPLRRFIVKLSIKSMSSCLSMKNTHIYEIHNTKSNISSFSTKNTNFYHVGILSLKYSRINWVPFAIICGLGCLKEFPSKEIDFNHETFPS